MADYQMSGLDITKQYLLSFEVKRAGAYGASVWLGSRQGMNNLFLPSSYNDVALGSHQVLFTPDVTNPWIRINASGGTTNDFVSVGSVIVIENEAVPLNATPDQLFSGGNVSVDLNTGTATGVGGTVANIVNVIGGAGDDTIIGPVANTTWTVDGPDSGNVGGITFSGIDNLTGAEDNEDTFIFEDGGSLSGQIDGGAAGFDTLEVNFSAIDQLTYDATGPDSGLVTADGNTISFVGLEPITVMGTDNLIVNVTPTPADLTLLMEGGVLKIDGLLLEEITIDPAGVATVTINFGGDNDSLTIGDVTGFDLDKLTVTGGGGTNTLIGPDALNTWMISDTNEGTLSSGGDTASFNDFQNLTGGSLSDNFVFEDGDGVSGTIDGAGGTDTLNYSAYSTAVTVDRQTTPNTTGVGGFANIESVTGGLVNDTLIGANAANTWNITGLNAGNIGGPGVFSFTGFENLTGGSQADDFVFENGDGVSGTIDGAGGTDTLDYSAYSTSVNVDLGGGTATGTGSVSNIDNVTGGSEGDTLAGDGGNNVLSGGLGDDTYVFGNLWGADTVTESAGQGADRLDFTGHTGALFVSKDKTTIADAIAGGDTVTQTNDLVETLDINFGATFKTALDSGLSQVVAFMDRLQDATDGVSELINALPLLNQALDTSLADISGFRAAFEEFRGDVAGIDLPTFSEIVAAIDALGLSNGTIAATADYRGEGTSLLGVPDATRGQLELLIDLDLDASVAEMFGLDLGEDGSLLGINIEADFSVNAAVDADVTLGLATDTPALFLADAQLDVTIDADVTLDGLDIGLGFLDVTLGTGTISYDGTVGITVLDPDMDGRITLAELTTSNLVDLVGAPDISGTAFSATVPVMIDAGVTIGGSNLTSGTFKLTLNPGDIFNGVAPTIELFSGSNNLLDFSNLGTNEVMAMLEQLVNTLTSMAQNEAMQIAVPFTEFTVGDLLDYATAFRAEVIDPLFASGSALVPDADGDGQLDFTFGSIQELITALSAVLSVATVEYKPDDKELRLIIDFSRALGFGSAAVGTFQEGGGGNNEIQDVEINAMDSGGTLTDTFRLGFTDATGRVQLTTPIAFNAPASRAAATAMGLDPLDSVQAKLEALEGIGAGNVDVMVNTDGDIYRIEFIGALANTNIVNMISDSTQLKGEFPLGFGLELGDLAGVTTSADFSVEATLDFGLTFGMDLSPTTTIELTGPTFNPQNVADVLISQPDDAEPSDFSTQIIRIDNATNGTFRLSFGASSTGDLDYDINEGALETAIFGLNGIASATISSAPTVELGDRIFEVALTFGASPVVPSLLAADVSNLKGAADGILSSTANFSFNLINRPVAVVTVERSNGSSTTGGNETILTDSAATFIADGVQVGDVIVNSTDGSTAVVTSVDITGTQITHTKLTEGISNKWQTGDDYQIFLGIPEANLGNFSVNVNQDTTNTSFSDLIEDIQEQVNTALVNALTPVTLGFLDGSTLSTGVLGVSDSDTADGDPLTTLRDDINFTLNLNVDPLGFGAAQVDFDGSTAETLALNAPVNGQLDHDVRFVLIDTANNNKQVEVEVLAENTSGFTTTAQLQTALQDAINLALEDLLGAGTLTTITVGLSGGKFTLLSDSANLAFIGNGEQEVAGKLRVVDVLDMTPEDTDDQLNLMELAVPVTAIDLAPALQSAVESALDTAGFGGFNVLVVDSGGRLMVTVDTTPNANDTLELVFQSPVQVEGGGGRISLVSPETKVSTHLLEPGVTVGHRLEVFAEFENPAYQELGLLSAPTRFDGVTGEDILFSLEVDGTPVLVLLPAGSHGGSVASLAADLQLAVNDGLTLAGLSLTDTEGDPLVKVFLIDDEGNRIGLRGGVGVAKLALNVPELNNAMMEPTGAITELGFSSGDGQPQSSKATEFFVEDVLLAGGFELRADDITATANIGFLEVTASGSGSLSANASLSFKNPDDGDTRINSDVLASALKDGRFIFNADDELAGIPTGFLDPNLSGGLDINLDVKPTGALSGLPLPADFDASLQLTLKSPDWFTILPTLDDPLGFGTDLIGFEGVGTTVFTLGAAPTGAIDSDVTFTISKDNGMGGTDEATGFINADDTALFGTATEYQTALQAAIDTALGELPGGGTVTVGLDGSDNWTLTGDSGLSFRSNFTFDGVDIDSILDQFKDLSFDDIIAGLRFVIDFLRSLDGSDGSSGGAVADVLDFQLPLIDRSVSDLLDFASDLSERIDLIASNPQGSIQALGIALKEQLGIPGGPDILSFNPMTGVLDIDFGFETSASVVRPLSLDIADALMMAGAPDFLSSVVTANASGQLTGTAGIDLDLKFGLDLTGDDKALFLRTGASGTKFNAFIGAALENPFFELGLGPFSVFSQGGTASIDGSFDVELISDSNDRLDLITFDDGSLGITLPTAANVDVTVTGDAVVDLPLFIGTPDNPVSIDTDPTDDTDPTNPVTNALNINIPSLDDLIAGTSGAFDVTLPDLSLFLNPPDLFALLANPSLIVNGLDKVLLTLEQGLQGQLFDFEIPLVGKALANNPAANIINDFRSDFLQPLARTLIENNVTLGVVDGMGEGDGLIGLIQDTLFDAFGPEGLGILLDHIVPMGTDITKSDIAHSGADLNSILTEEFIQFDFKIGQRKVISLGDVEFDFGLPGLSLAADFTPILTLDWELDFGFGVDKELGFYFVTADADELALTVTLDLGSEIGPDVANAQGQLAFLALNLTDGVDIGGDPGKEFTELVLKATVDLVDPTTDIMDRSFGRLTIGELVAGPIGDIFQASFMADADIRMHAVVDFSAISPTLSNVLPSVSTDILAHFHLELNPTDGFVVDSPSVAFLDVTLDVGSFISEFAGPILNSIGDVLDNVDFLVGPDGFLNKRIPLLSDLAGKTITGKDLVKLFDPKNGPKVVAVLDAIDELFFFVDLVRDAAQEAKDGDLLLVFGDVILSDPGSYFSTLPDFESLFDSLIDFNLPDLDAGTVKSFDPKQFDNDQPADQKLESKKQNTGTKGKKTQRFESGVTGGGSLQFNLFQPETVFKLILGQPDITLFTYELPEFGFDFFYRQEFPIFGPVVAFFGGGVSANFDFGFGYDTRGLQQFLATDNPAYLLNGFFLNDLDPVTGFDRAEVTLKAQIAVGGGVSIGFAKAGVEGGIEATIELNLADLDQDGKIRFDELAGNLAANSFIPFAIFDISGKIDFFMRAFLEINLLFVKIKKEFEFVRVTLFEFNIPFIRPAILASQAGDILTLNIGENAGSRLNGNISDIAETINVETVGSGVVVWSNQFNVLRGIALTNPFVGVKKIVAFGGLGNDTIDLTGVADAGIKLEIHGGDGNDQIFGGVGNDALFGDGGMDIILGRQGDDTIDGGLGDDILHGNEGNDTILGGFGNDMLFGDGDNDSLDGGPGDDTLDGGSGDDFYVLESAGSLDFISGGGDGLDILDFSGKFENISFFLRNGQALAGWGTRTGSFTNPLNNIMGLGNWLEDFEHMVVANTLADVSAVFGGFGADTFHVYETRNDMDTLGETIITLLDGQGSDDTYLFYADDSTPIEVFISDNGNNWDLNNQIEVRGTGLAEDITVTSTDITVENAAMMAAGVSQIIRYVSPKVDENLLQIKVKSFGGDDNVSVLSTSITVPVKVFAGMGDDTLTVGDGVVDNINSVFRPGLDRPFGRGPLTLIGEEGHDTVIIDDSADSAGEKTSGNPTDVSTNRATVLTDSNANFMADGVQEGDVIVNLTDGSSATVISVDSNNQITHTALTGGTTSGTSTDDSDLTGTMLIDMSATFMADGVQAGDIIVNSADGSTAEVLTVVSETEITHTALTGGTTWQIADDYEIFNVWQLTDEYSIPDPAGDTGYLTSFIETRPGDIQVEVGVVNDLGMTLSELVGSEITDDEFEFTGPPVDLVYDLEEVATTVFVDILDEDGNTVNILTGTTDSGLNTVSFDGTDFREDPVGPLPAGTYTYKIRAFKATPGRVEFEGFEVVDVRMGLGDDSFSVGVEDIVGQLALDRQDKFDPIENPGDFSFFTHTIDGMTIVSGGGGNDTIQVETTNTLDRDTLNADLGIVSASPITTGGPGINEVQKVTIGAEVGYFTLKFRFQETAPIVLNASAEEVKAALEKLFIIGENSIDVTKDSDGFTIEFVNDLGETDVAQLEARVTPLTIFGDDGEDVLLVEAVNQDTFFLGGSGGDFVQLNFDIDSGVPLLTNGVNAVVTLDGGNESDIYNIGLIGGVTNSLINIFDSGGPGTDVLNMTGTVDNDLFLLRAAAAQSGLAFVALLGTDPVETDPALLNSDSNFERVTYNTQLETINILSVEGDDQFYIDDTRAAITIDAGIGNDFFQVGQLFKSQRTTLQAGVAQEDVFATIETTRGFLSNGISAPLTINAGAGNDEFIVFHNKAVLTANGEEDDDRFLIQAFALVGSQEDLRERTDVSGGADADFIAYAVNAPVAINGGDGFDTVVVVGTEFSDDFVITEDGVFGAGINVSFVNVEEVEVSGSEGDDRFFILGTGETFSTRVVGDLGSDTFFINGETPANGVISNDLLGHSGILTTDVVSDDPDSGYDGLKAVGVSANIADNDEPAIIINQSNGDSQVVEGGTYDTYTVVLSRAPRPGTKVKVTALAPEGLVFVKADGVTEILKVDGTADGVELKFDGTNWNVEQTVRFKAIADGPGLGDGIVEGNRTAAIQHKVSTFDINIEPVLERQDVVINVPFFSFQPIFKTINIWPFGSVKILVGIKKVQIGTFPVVIGTQLVQVGTIGTEVTVEDAFTGVAEEAIGLKSDVSVKTTTDGNPGTLADEVQTVTVVPGPGSYTLRFGLEDTDLIDFGASALDVEAALKGLDGIGNTDVSVSLDDSGADNIYTISFTGDLAATDVEELIARVGASLRDDQGAFPTAGTDSSRPQGLRGSFVTIIDDPGNPNSVGQSRLILSNTGTVLTLDQAWDALPSTQARYEVLQFNGLVIPTVEVAIEDADVATLVVLQSDADTIVAEGSLSGSDTIDVSLSMSLAVGEIVRVDLDGFGQLEFSGSNVMSDVNGSFLQFNESNFDFVQRVTVTAFDDGVVEGFHRVDLTLTTSSNQMDSDYNFNGGVQHTLVADVGDNDHEGVLIRESNGSTNVVEGADPSSSISQGKDDYTVVLTKAPEAGEIVTVTVTAQPTRTSRTGSIAGNPDSVRSFVEQLEVSSDNGLTFGKTAIVEFTSANWDLEQTILVRAIDDNIVDGGDTKVFAPILDLANNIQGPLFIIGGIGVDRSGLFEREPVMLPVSANPIFDREVNFKDSVGDVLAATEAGAAGVPAATITIDPNDSRLLEFLGVANKADINLEKLNDLALEITRGEAKNKVRFVENAEFVGVGDNELLLTLNKAWNNALTPPGVPDATSEYTLFDTNPNFFVVEGDQTDILILNDTDNVTSFADSDFAVGQLFFDDSFGFDGHRITGLGMGANRFIGGREQPGGVSFQELEELELNLGTGANEFTIEDTHEGITTLNTGAGDDVVNIKKIAGHTFVNTGAGTDTVNVHNDAQNLTDLLGLLTVSGDIPQATTVNLANGSPAIGDLVSAVDAIQRLTVDATGGTFTLALGGEVTGDLAHNISAVDLQTELQALVVVEYGVDGTEADVKVTKAGGIYRISFVNELAAQKIDLLAVNDFNLTNGLGVNDTLNIDDTGFNLSTVGVLSTTTLTGLSLPQANEIQTIVVDATQGAFRLTYDGEETGDFDFDVSAEDMELALENLAGIGTDNVAVTKNDDVFVVRFQGDLTNSNVLQIGAVNLNLEIVTEVERDVINTVDGSVISHTRVNGNEARQVNDVQTVTVDATGGTYTLTVFGRTTDAIAFDASAEVVRKQLQLAVADDKFEEVKTDITVDKYDNVYVVGFQGKLREINGLPGVDFMTTDTSSLTGNIEIATRMDGINYYGFETVNIDLNSMGHLFNVQGTTPGSNGFALGADGLAGTADDGFASTNVSLGDGDEQIFISSNADMDFDSVNGFDFLRGDLDAVLGAINLDTGLGRHRLMISDEGTDVGDDDVRISDINSDTGNSIIDELQGLTDSADIWIQGMAEGGISYRTDGNFYDGIIYWTGSGNDVINIEGTHFTSGERTNTLLNTGLGDDQVTVDLDAGEDGFFVLNTMGGAESPNPAAFDGANDDDTVDASASSLPLTLFGGLGADDFTSGSGNDLVIGDFGRVQYFDDLGNVIAVHGFGGRGDILSSEIVDAKLLFSVDRNIGGNPLPGGEVQGDTLRGGEGEDVVIGGAGNDRLDGNEGRDLIFGDNVNLDRRGMLYMDYTNPRFRPLLGTQIYGETPGVDDGEDLVDNSQDYVDPTGFAVWNDWEIELLDHLDTGIQFNRFGNDYVAGGSEDDMIFGQLGNDTIQGDGSIDLAVDAGASRNAANQLILNSSFEGANDGDDYIEGNGGNDVIFGNTGQDDIIGGSSDLFSLDTPEQRPDGSDLIFGGAGTDASRNNPGDTSAEGHAQDADMILGDNGDIFRLLQPADTTQFEFFNYDNYSGLLKIIPRAARLLDYTPGGADFDAASAATDIGAGDEIHGESGDDFIYAQVGDDVVFGEGQDDDIIGGWGNDWISGGTGSDGVLGDDGRIYTSRNSIVFGESLFGITALSAVNVVIDTPGNIQVATINVDSQLKKSVNLTPFNVDPAGLQDALFNPTQADDIIFGGLGDDFLHGGAGDDAISGAEALSGTADTEVTDGLGSLFTVGYDTPFNPGNILGFEALRAGEFAAYDEFNPLVKIENFFLNFDETEGPIASGSTLGKATDGDDRIFGDLGNDWLVGGTGRDTSYGGRGNDLMNADDDLNTNDGLNDTPDGPEYSYEDRAFGGAGRDVLIANTGGDRLIDWVGEFNSFLVPFAPFGPPTVSRALQPQIAEFLYDLSESDGADPTRAADTGNDAARNGEPDGELGVVIQKDDDWSTQTGAPADPQAGNIPGGPRDIRGGADFNSGTAEGFFADSGTWTVSGGRFEVAPETLGADAVSVYMVNEYLPNYFELKATINGGKPTAGLKSNAYLIFDYQSETDFKFAGVNISTDKMEIGHRDAEGWHVVAQTSSRLKPNKDYDLLLSLNGTAITLVVNNQDVFNYVYAPRVDTDGFSYGLNAGMVGIGSQNSVARIDNVKVQVLPPEITFEDTDDFTVPATLFTGLTMGDWQVDNERYEVDATTGLAQSLAGLTVDGSSLIRLESVMSTDAIAGFTFDRYSANDFKFAAISASDNQVIIGHLANKGWVVDTSANWVINSNQDYNVDVTVKGSTVSVLVNGQTIVSHAFNAVAVDGAFGLLAKDGMASFDTVTFGTDDRAFEVPEAALMAAQSAGESTATASLTHGELEKIFQAAVTRWTKVGYIDQARLATLDDLELTIADMAGLTLGRSSGNQIFIDTNAAGYGWFVDETPDANEEFLLSSNGWVANPNSDAYGKMDLLTAVSHEIGHYLGLDHDDATSDTSVMNDTLESGYRYVGEDTLLSSAFFAAGSAFMEEALGLTEESEDDEDGSEDTLALVFDEGSGEFLGSESEEISDDEWVIDNSEPEPDEDVYALFDLENDDFTPLAGLSQDNNNGKSGSRINWNGRFTY